MLALHHWIHIPSYRPQPLFKLLIKDVIITVEGGWVQSCMHQEHNV